MIFALVSCAFELPLDLNHKERRAGRGRHDFVEERAVGEHLDGAGVHRLEGWDVSVSGWKRLFRLLVLLVFELASAKIVRDFRGSQDLCCNES